MLLPFYKQGNRKSKWLLKITEKTNQYSSYSDGEHFTPGCVSYLLSCHQSCPPPTRVFSRPPEMFSSTQVLLLVLRCLSPCKSPHPDSSHRACYRFINVFVRILKTTLCGRYNYCSHCVGKETETQAVKQTPQYHRA